MTGASRTVFELIANPGSNPEEQVDTDELDPPVYEEIVARGVRQFEVGPAASVTVALPASCYVLILATSEVLLRLVAGETQMRIRKLEIGAVDAEGAGLPATTLVFGGNGTDTAEVTIRYLEQVA